MSTGAGQGASKSAVALEGFLGAKPTEEQGEYFRWTERL